MSNSTHPSTYHSILIRSYVILSCTGFLIVGTPLMTLVSSLCIQSAPGDDGCHSHADDAMRLIVTQIMIVIMLTRASCMGGFLTWPEAGGLNEGYWCVSCVRCQHGPHPKPTQAPPRTKPLLNFGIWGILWDTGRSKIDQMTASAPQIQLHHLNSALLGSQWKMMSTTN